MAVSLFSLVLLLLLLVRLEELDDSLDELQKNKSSINDPNHVQPQILNYDIFPLYDSAPNAMGILVSSYISIPRHYVLLEKIKVIASDLGKSRFHRQIDVLRIENRAGNQIAIINLEDASWANRKWEQAFQGSAGGSITTGILLRSFLQKEYDGDWIDGVEFYLNGEPFVDGDRTALGGVKFRTELN